MRIVLKECKVYKFDELDDYVKSELIDKERRDQEELYCEYGLYEDLQYKASELIKDYFGITSDYLKVNYDLSYSQGSGAMVVFDISIKDLNNKYKVFSDEEIELLSNKYVVSNIKIRHNDNFYWHEYTFDIDYDFYMGLEYDDIKEHYKITENEFNTLENRLHELLDSSNKHSTKSEFVKDIIELNKELARYGFDCINYFNNCDDEEMICYIKDREDEYLENGDVF